MCVRSLGYNVGASPPCAHSIETTVGVYPLVCVHSLGYTVGASPLCVSCIMYQASCIMHGVMKYDIMKYDVMRYDIIKYDMMKMKKTSF